MEEEGEGARWGSRTLPCSTSPGQGIAGRRGMVMTAICLEGLSARGSPQTCWRNEVLQQRVRLGAQIESLDMFVPWNSEHVSLLKRRALVSVYAQSGSGAIASAFVGVGWRDLDLQVAQ